MTRATAYRVHTNAAPMSGRTIIAPLVRNPHPSDGLWRANWPEIVLTVILSAAVLFMAGVAVLVVAG